MSAVKAVSKTQRIIVNPANGAISVVNAGPMGPAGPIGPSEAESILTVDGDVLTRISGALARITRINLAADTAFTNAFQPKDSDLTAIAALTTTSFGRSLLTAANMAAIAADSAFSAAFPSVVAHAATATQARIGTAVNIWIGSVNPTTNAQGNDFLYRTDQGTWYFRAAGNWVEIGSTRWAPIKRIIDRKEATASSWTNATGTLSDVTVTSGSAPSITAALDTTHLYRMVYDGRFSSTVDGDQLGITFIENGTSRKGCLARMQTTQPDTVHHEWVFVPASASSVVYKLQGSRVSGTGTVSLTSSASSPSLFYIEDLGTS